VARASPAGADLLRLCAFLGPEPVPLHLFSANASQLGDAAGDDVAFSPVLGALLGRSLVRRGADGSSIVVHRLPSAAVRARAPLNPEQRDATLATVRELLHQTSPR
jgi:hypothetical protein